MFAISEPICKLANQTDHSVPPQLGSQLLKAVSEGQRPASPLATRAMPQSVILISGQPSNIGAFGKCRNAGRRAIAGFLYQILRSVQFGLRVIADLVADDPANPIMTLALEPEDAGDHRLARPDLMIIEQI